MFHCEQTDEACCCCSCKPQDDLQSFPSKANDFHCTLPSNNLILKNKHSMERLPLVLILEQVHCENMPNSSTVQTNSDVQHLVPGHNVSNSENTLRTTNTFDVEDDNVGDSSLQPNLPDLTHSIHSHHKLKSQYGYESQLNECINPIYSDQYHRKTDQQQCYSTEIKLYLNNNRITNYEKDNFSETYDSENLNDQIQKEIYHVKAVPCKIMYTNHDNSSPKA
ncbi:unnamed protein product [Schistosoma turkestanicum]|nr:unnamed protein product [Schistosoma turkestanicum]